MELTAAYAENQTVSKEEYMVYRDRKLNEFLAHAESFVSLDTKARNHIKYGFLKGLDTATKGGSRLEREDL
jgi:hypothetical protein